MRLRPTGLRPFPLPVSVLLSVLWTGLVHLLLALAAAAQPPVGGAAPVVALWRYELLGAVRLPTLLMVINLLLIGYLWLDYRARRRRGRRGSLLFLAAALLLVHLGWAVWRAWWTEVNRPPVAPGTVFAVVAEPR